MGINHIIILTLKSIRFQMHTFKKYENGNNYCAAFHFARIVLFIFIILFYIIYVIN